MKAHEKYRKNLALHAFGELNEAERAELEAHLAGCAECRAELEQLRALRRAAPAQPAWEPDEAALQSLRNRVSREIRRRAHKSTGFGGQLLNFLQPAPLLRIGLAAALFIIGFFLGRQGLPSKPGDADAVLQELLTASGQVQSGNSAVNPLLASVERIEYDSQTGKIRIFYTTLNDIELRGNLLRQTGDDAAIRQLLREALLEEQNPAVRLHAVKAVTSLAEQNAPLGGDIIEALAMLLEKEQNPGVRLRVLRALKHAAPDPALKITLLRILLDDPNPALRIEALEALLSGELSAEDLNILKKVARQDSNSYVRSLAGQALDKAEKAPAPANI